MVNRLFVRTSSQLQPRLLLYMQTIFHKLPSPFRRSLPGHTVLGKLLHSGSQFSLVQREIIHTANAQNTHAREGCTDAVHERAARGTEVVGHVVVLARSFEKHSARLAVCLQVVAATQMFQVRVIDREVGRMHGCRKLVAVRAVTDEGAKVARSMGWLGGESRC